MCDEDWIFTEDFCVRQLSYEAHLREAAHSNTLKCTSL